MVETRRKMKRWKKVLLWLTGILVVVVISGLLAANYAMDKMLAQLSNSLEDELLADTLLETNEPVLVDKNDTQQNQDEVNQLSPDNNDEEINQSDDHEEIQDPQTTKPSSEPSKGSTEYSAEVSVDKAKDVQEKITVGEKAKLATVFLKELSADDIKYLQELASGGLSIDEKKAARTLILERLSPEQYDELIQIAKKYGMSQGKSYEEVSKEK
ncbi:hypothetical protein ACX93W_18590 [Paenibacillus sp. CAU 1782]